MKISISIFVSAFFTWVFYYFGEAKWKDWSKTLGLNEDELRSLTKEIQELTDKYIKNIDTLTSKKEKEVMSF